MLDNLKGYEIILASNSPRRRELLGMLGLEFSSSVSGSAECCPSGLEGSEMAMYLSEQKALSSSLKMNPNTLIIAADTIVWLDGKPLGKPHDEQEAVHMLRSLSGMAHHVFTGVTLRTSSLLHSFYGDTAVSFAQLSDEEIIHYIHTCHPFDKAGSYGIQEWIGMIGITSIEGCYYNVMGLPVSHLYEELKKIPVCF